MTTQTLSITLQYDHTVGRAEFSGPGFRNPVAMARGEDDTMYVVSRSYEYRPDGKRITICTVDEDYIGEFARGVTDVGESEASSADGAIIWPTAIALDSEGYVYVADEALNRISIYTKDGEYLKKWERPGKGDGEWDKPSGLAFDRQDNLYLVDSGNNRIQKLTKDGDFIAQWGSKGSGDGQFDLPWGIEIDQDQNVFIADWRNDRIQKFTSNGEFLMTFGSTGAGDGEFNRPTGVAVDKDGEIYVADWNNDRLQVFNRDGQYLTQTSGEGTLSQWGANKLDGGNPEMWEERKIAQNLDREKNFWGPVAVEVDDEGRIFVVESARSRIQIFHKQYPVFYGAGEKVSGGGGRL
jgi:DNA-binding beta-propeller fold protein YncE